MSDLRPTETVSRPAACPFCNGKRFETLAKTITPAAMWRCRDCEGTWTIASQTKAPARPTYRR